MIVQRLKYANVFLFILIAAAIFILAALSNQYFVIYLNSDYLYLFETAKFLFSHHTLVGQNQPVAPYYFPDLTLLTALNYLTQNILLQHFLYAITFLTLYGGMVHQLIKLCFHEKTLALYGTLLALMVSFFIIFPHFSFLEEWSGSHLSIIIFSLFFINFYGRTLQNPIKIKTFIGFFLIILAMFLSDKLLFPQFLLPMSFVIIMDTYQKKIEFKKNFFWLGMFLGVILLGLKMEKWLNYFDISTSYNANLFRIRNSEMLGQTIVNEYQVFLVALKKNSDVYGLLLFFQVSIFFLFKKNNHLSRVVLFLVGSQLSDLLLVFISGKFNQIEHLRYLAPIYFYPPILVMLTMLLFLTRKKYATYAIVFNILFVFCTVGIFFKTYYIKFHNFNFQPLYPEDVRCIDALNKTYSIHNGLAQYWYMRDIRLLSQKHLQIAQMDKWLNRVNYLDNRANFYVKGNKLHPLFYQFIIVNALPKQQLIARFGKPDQIVFCQNTEVWMYQQAEHLNQLNQAIIQKDIIKY